MAYDQITNRDDATALMPEEVSKVFLKGLDDKSAVLNQFTRIPVGRKQVRLPVLAALPHAYWVTGDTGLKQTTKVSWKNKFLNIEEIAVIVPVPDAVIDDSDEPIWDQVRPLCEQAGGRAIDQAVFFGENAPEIFPDDIVSAATAAGNVATIGTTDPDEGGIVGDHSLMLDKLEEDGYDVSEGVAARAIRGKVRQARNTDGDRLGEVKVNKDNVEIDGVTYTHPMRGLWPTGSGAVQAIAFDSTEFVVGVRQDVTWKLLTEAVITDSDNNIVYNLAQQDMSALRMVMRVGWQVANTINYDEPDEEERYPAGLLKKA